MSFVLTTKNIGQEFRKPCFKLPFRQSMNFIKYWTVFDIYSDSSSAKVWPCERRQLLDSISYTSAFEGVVVL